MSWPTRFIRRYESWPSDPGPYSSGWQYYVQEQHPRFWLFGAPTWRDVAGPFSSETSMLNAVSARIRELELLGREEVLPTPPLDAGRKET